MKVSVIIAGLQRAQTPCAPSLTALLAVPQEVEFDLLWTMVSRDGSGEILAECRVNIQPSSVAAAEEHGEGAALRRGIQ